MLRILQTTSLVLAAAQVAQGHTWIEQLRNINDKGEYVGAYGYPRGMVAKTDPGFDGFSMNIELPAYQKKLFIDDTTPLCHPSQRKQVQSQDKYPRLQTSPGTFIAMRYAENGHVTKPNNQLGKPKKGGTVFVYGTVEPKEDERLTNILQWNKDASGGDKRGVLLATNDFDDGRCYEVNETPVSANRRKTDPNYAFGAAATGPGNYPLMCETNVQLPKTAAVGKPYTLYWVWQWNTAPNVDPGLPKGKDEYYTTCIDVDVASQNATAKAADAQQKHGLGAQQDAMAQAVADYASRSALMANPIQGEVGPFFKSQTDPVPSPKVSGGPPQPSSGPIYSGNSTTPTGVPNRTRSHGQKPTQQPSGSGGENVVTVTSTKVVTVTVTATPSGEAPPNPITPTPQPSAGNSSSPLGGFSMNNPHGAKFRRHVDG